MGVLQKHIFFFGMLFLLSCLVLPFAQARYISLTNTFTLTPQEQGFSLTITTKNNGDETAFGVVHSLFSANGSFLMNTAEQNIAPGSEAVFHLEKIIAKAPFVVKTLYHDANYYPFSLLSFLQHDAPVLSSLRITAAPLLFLEKTSAQFSVKNNALSSRLHYVVFAPQELLVKPSSGTLIFDNSSEQRFSFTIKNNGMLYGNQNTLLLLFTNGTHWTSKTVVVKRYQGSLLGKLLFFVREYPLQMFFALGVFLFLIFLLLKKFPQHWFTLLSFLLLYGFLLSYFSPSLLFSSTITTGGDTASHYYTLQFLYDHFTSFFPNLSSWIMGNYAGFPLLHYYFILPFLVMILLSFLVGLPIAFKLGTLLGTFLLPLSVFFFFKKIRLPFPWPLVGAYASLLFLFNTGNSMWGGNIPSTLAGEFSYSLSFALLWFFLGFMVEFLLLLRKQKQPHFRAFTMPVLVLFLIGLSHVYTVLLGYAFFPFFFLFGFSRKSWKSLLLWLAQLYGTVTLLLGIFYLPLYFRLGYTTAYADFWHITLKEVFPQIFWLAFGLGMLGLLGLLLLQRKHFLKQFFSRSLRSSLFYQQLGFFFLLALVMLAVIFFFSAVSLGVVNIRFIPFLQLTLVLLSIFLFARFSLVLWEKKKSSALFLLFHKSWVQKLLVLFLLVALLSWVSAHESYIPHWIKWNYEGFEQKQPWPLFQEINTQLSVPIMMQAPRVVFEHNGAHNIFGTIRAFESLPLFANRATLEGLYMQSSLNAPFIFYMQSLYSVQQSCPFPHFGCSHTNLSLAYPYFRLYNVGQEIVVTDAVRKAMDALPFYQEWQSFQAYGKHYSIYNISLVNTSYVEIPKYKPVVLSQPYNQKLAFLWFLQPEQLAVPLVFSEEPIENPSFVSLPVSTVENTTELIDEVSHLPQEPLQHNGSCIIKNLTLDHHRIQFTTSCPELPHLLKISYFPNWQSKQARIYHAAPSFMMLIPHTSSVVLEWKMTFVDWLGVVSFLLGLLALLFFLPIARFLHNLFIPLLKKTSFWLILAVFVLLFLGLFFSLHHFFGFQQEQYQKAIAVATKSWRACDYAGQLRDECLIAVGALTYDYNLCFVEVSSEKKNACFSAIATAFHDTNLCGYITDATLKEACFQNIE